MPTSIPGSGDALDSLVATSFHRSVEARLQRTSEILQDLRQRTGTIVAASGVITALFGAKVITDPDGALPWISIGLALTMLALSLWNCLWILAPVKDRGDVPLDVDHDLERALSSYLARYLPLERQREWKLGLDESEFGEIAMQAREAILGGHAGAAHESDELRRHVETLMARRLEHCRKLNIRTIDRRSRWFEGASALLLAQVAFWVIAAAVE